MSSHYFVAIHLPEEQQRYFSKRQQELKQEWPYKIWPHQADLHITLKFLGPVADDNLRLLQQELKEIQKSDPFTIETYGLGTFGNTGKPRVLWAGVEKTEPLIQLQQKVEAQCSAAGFAKDKCAYVPHITLAKKWNSKEMKQTEQMLQNNRIEKQIWHVENIVLFRIHPQENPKYEAVSIFPLNGGGGTGAAD
jgi:2'-5' RNA ligase